jgi:hypothetical protein
MSNITTVDEIQEALNPQQTAIKKQKKEDVRLFEVKQREKSSMLKSFKNNCHSSGINYFLTPKQLSNVRG